MKPHEDIFDYIERVKEPRTAILVGETTENGFLDPNVKDYVEHTTRESFVNGLPSDLLIRVKLERCYTLEETIMTIQLSKQLEAEALRKRTYPSKTNLSFQADVPRKSTQNLIPIFHKELV